MSFVFGSDFLQLRLFKALPPVQQVSFVKALEPHGVLLEAADAGGTLLPVMLLEMLGSAEKPLWEAVREITALAVKNAESRLFGTFALELLTLGDRLRWRTLEAHNLAELFVNHGRMLQPGEERLFSYASLSFRLKKLVPADWGTLRFAHHFVVFSAERAKLDLTVKKLLDLACAQAKPVWIVIRDFSSDPIFRFGEEPQTDRLLKLLTRRKDLFPEKAAAVLAVTEQGVTDLVQQFGILDSQGG